MRLILAGTHSNCGKTTMALALMRAFCQSGETVFPYKIGPDYIDPTYHRVATGQDSYNLDMHIMGKKAVRGSLSRRSHGLCLMEGVMGYYDGMGTGGFACSTYEMALETDTPAVLVIDAAGGALSTAAVAHGFCAFTPNSGIKGVVFSRVGSPAHYELLKDALHRHTPLTAYGYLPKMQNVALPSRHLGLHLAQEIPALNEKLDALAQQAAHTVDLAGLKALASAAPPLDPPMISTSLPRLPLRIGVARDAAFQFYYEENFQLLRSLGAKLTFFSPLRDSALPDGLDALYLGGGYPENALDALSKNQNMMRSVRTALEQGLPCYAECGGMMYLSAAIDGVPMVGALPQDIVMTDRLQHFGYVYAQNGPLCVSGHSFHYSKAIPQREVPPLWQVRRASKQDSTWADGMMLHRIKAAYTHLHFSQDPNMLPFLFSLAKEAPSCAENA